MYVCMYVCADFAKHAYFVLISPRKEKRCGYSLEALHLAVSFYGDVREKSTLCFLDERKSYVIHLNNGHSNFCFTRGNIYRLYLVLLLSFETDKRGTIIYM